MDKPCPCCGYCPACGRRDTQPVYPVPVYPQPIPTFPYPAYPWAQPVYPSLQPTIITATGTSNTMLWNGMEIQVQQ